MKKLFKKSIAILFVISLFSIFIESIGSNQNFKTVTAATMQPSVTYSTHIQSLGWQEDINDGQISGTTGLAKRLEGIKIDIKNTNLSGNVEYRTHVQQNGWMDWKSNKEVSGTTGESKRLEAIEIRLTGNLAEQYNIYYRVHAEKIGWLNWTKDSEPAGTEGYSYRLEAIEIKLVKKGEKVLSNGGDAFKKNVKVPSIAYQTHVQSTGWQGYKKDGQMSGTSGLSKRIEGIKLNLSNLPYSGGIKYRTHVQKNGWMNWKNDNVLSGTTGQAKRLEAIEIELTGEMAKYFDVYYRVHVQTFGWLGWAKNNEPAGSAGYARRLEGIEVKLVEKGNLAPGSTATPFKDKNVKIEKKIIQTKEKDVDFTIIEKNSGDLFEGETSIEQKGIKGFDIVDYEVTYTNDKETNRIEVTRKTTKPTNQIIKIGTKPNIVKIEQETKQENEVNFQIIEENDEMLDLGKFEVIQKGQMGYDSVMYEVTYTNGKETNRKEVTRKNTKPVNQVVKVGTKEIRVENIITLENTIPYSTINFYSNLINDNEVVDIQNGQDGYDEVTREVTYVNNVEISSKEINRIKYDSIDKIIFRKSENIIASIGNIVINSLYIEEELVYLDEWTSNKLIMNADIDEENINKITVTYLLPNGIDKSTDFIKVDEGVYEANIDSDPSSNVGEGTYKVKSINVSNKKGDPTIIFPAGDTFTLNNISANLLESEFEVKVRPLELTDPRVALNKLTVQINNISYTEGNNSDVFEINYTETNNTDQRIDQDSFKVYLADGTYQTQYGFFNTLMPGESSTRTYSFDLLKSEKPGILEYGDVFFNASPNAENLIWDVSEVNFKE